MRPYRTSFSGMLPAALRAVRAADGVIDVESQLGYAIDDIRLPRVPVKGH
jgi:hypothetical protein